MIQVETSGKALFAAAGVVVGAVGFSLYQRLSNAAPPAVVASPVVEATPVPLPQVAPGQLAFSDEFSGTSLDASKWLDSYPDGARTHSNNEQQYYAPEGVTFRDGKMIFTAKREQRGGMPYTSGMVSSYGKFSQKYGRFELRARFPKGKGLWPAFWLLPVTKNWTYEIDILEILGHDLKTVYFTNHWRNESGKVVNAQGVLRGIDLSADFHTYTLDWTEKALIWSVDGVERHRTTEHVPQEPMYVLANLAVGGNWPGFPDGSTPFPSSMELDYIRVYAPKP